MYLLNVLQSDWFCQHSSDVHENLSIVTRCSFPTFLCAAAGHAVKFILTSELRTTFQETTACPQIPVSERNWSSLTILHKLSLCRDTIAVPSL